MLFAANNTVGCAPFAAVSVKEKVVARGVIGISQKIELTRLEVVLASKDWPELVPGTHVYVHGESAKDLWAKPLELGGVPIVFVPLDRVVAVEYLDPPAVEGNTTGPLVTTPIFFPPGAR